ncbi:MAG: HDOD domain-containing protein [Campylobacterota bacterium]|nr:HDOD domain-containing protein [Campylobacterota bacterium]
MSYIPLIARVDSLPPLPESVLKIEEIFAQGEPDIDKIVKIIELDPSLTADILSKVNAPYYGFSKSIVSILQAITLFGASQIRSIVLASTIQRNFDIDLSPYGISTSEFSKISTMQSELIFQWYIGIDVDIARSLTTIAFLMETGKILIAKETLQNEKQDAFLNDISTYEDISYVENMHTMMTSAQINTLIFKHFNLNDSFCESMKYLDNQQEIPTNMKEMVTALQIVRTAINVKDQLNEHSLNNASKLLEDHMYNINTFKRAAARVKNRYIEVP